MQLAACAGGALALAVAAYYVRQHPHTVARVRKLLQLQPHRQQRHRSRTEQLGPIGGTTVRLSLSVCLSYVTAIGSRALQEEQLSDEARPALHALESVRQVCLGKRRRSVA